MTLLKQMNVQFAGKPKEDVEEFLQKIADARNFVKFTDEDILSMVPMILTDNALHWARAHFENWHSLNEFAAALRRQYGIPDFQVRLQNEIINRTQGRSEPISSYVSGLQRLMNRLQPRWPLEQQLDRAHLNLNPYYADRIERSKYSTFDELQRLGQEVEIRKERARMYHSPPRPSLVMCPSSACPEEFNSISNRKGHTAAISDYASSKSCDKNFKIMAIEPTSQIVKKDENSNSPSNRQSILQKNSQNSRNRPNKQSSFHSSNATRTSSSTPRLSSPQPHKISPAPTAPPKTSKITSSRSLNSPDKQKKAMPCWICRSDQHWAAKCPNRTGKLCYKCGYPDVIISTCPNCSPNQGNE